VAGVLADPQVQARRMIQAVEHVSAGMLRVLGIAVKLSDTPGSIRTAPPRLGQHTVEILEELGFSAPAIQDLQQRGVV
jgi:formyl-CoA transferase/CoA:oxalate CoA-transferase